LERILNMDRRDDKEYMRAIMSSALACIREERTDMAEDLLSDYLDEKIEKRRTFSPEFIYRVRSKARMIDLFEGYANKKTCYIADCPYCDTDGSFVMLDNTYRCDCCEVEGDAVSFLMEKKSLSFNEAIERLAEIYDVEG